MAHTAMIPPATANADGRPVARDVALAKLVNQDEDFVGLMSNLQARYGAIGVRYLEKRLTRTGTPQLRRLCTWATDRTSNNIRAADTNLYRPAIRP
jgi:hypothetical protein